MAAASTAKDVSPKLLEVAERARRNPKMRFFSLAHLLDEQALARSYDRIRKDAAVGVDGMTKEQYGQDLTRNLRTLHEQMRSMRYRHQLVRRVHIPKDKGKTRPIGVSCITDKVVQGALCEVLEAIYEPVFFDGSYGFRHGRSAHDALRALNRVLKEQDVRFILEADIVSFFDSIDRTMLMEMLRERVVDTSLLRLVGKCLHVGILDGEEFSKPDEGTVQGSALSPMLGNIFLHHVLDQWFEHVVRPRMRGQVHLIRYADDFVITFELEEDAKRVAEVLPKRFERYGLKLHPDKTRLLPFSRPPRGQGGGKGMATFDFLSFTHYWRRSRWGTWVPGLKTRTARLRRAITAVADFCRRQRHKPVKEQHAGLKRRLEGHFNYFGVNGNIRCLKMLVHEAESLWRKWLRRRSQRTRLTWKRYKATILRAFPLPSPKICVQIWASP
jgi:group II intron reverse transcriptase/maturase